MKKEKRRVTVVRKYTVSLKVVYNPVDSFECKKVETLVNSTSPPILLL